MISAKKYVLFAGLLIFSVCAKAQQIQWADHVVFQYNQFDENDFSARELLGPPDAFPYGKMSNKAFRLNGESAYGIATVGFSQPVQVKQIIIVENFLPNRIAKIVLKDTDGREHLIHEPKHAVMHIPYRVQSINIECTPYKVAALSIHLNTLDKPGWAQIDAIGISDKVNDNQQLAALLDINDYNIEENIQFSGEKEKLNRNINTDFTEAKPVLSPDGKTLYFVRKYNPANFGGKSDEQDIYYSELINGRWTVAQNIGAPLNDKHPNGICSVSPDGNTIYVLNAYNFRTGLVQDGVSVSYRQPNGEWSFPQKLNIDNFYNLNEFQDYYVSASGNTLILAIERENGQGNQDLHVSFRRDDNTWTEPQNLGSSINTQQEEYSPYLSQDEKVLFFTSQGHSADEEGDIFYAKRLDDTWLNWSAPKNIGYEINSAGLDAYFTIAPNNEYAYFVSSDESGVPEASLKPGLDIYRIPMNIEPEPLNVLAVKGRLINKANNSGVQGKVQMHSAEKTTYKGFAVSNSQTGDFNMKMADEGTYEITAEAEGFISYNEKITLKEENPGEGIVLNIEMEPLSKGHKFALKDLFFVRSEAEMLPGSEPELERLVGIMKQNPKIHIELGGHTDNEGYRSANIRLSQQRADAVRNYLIEKGVDARRIRSVGYGPNHPVAPNDTEDNKAKNRRVEVEITKVD